MSGIPVFWILPAKRSPWSHLDGWNHCVVYAPFIRSPLSHLDGWNHCGVNAPAIRSPWSHLDGWNHCAVNAPAIRSPWSHLDGWNHCIVNAPAIRSPWSHLDGWNPLSNFELEEVLPLLLFLLWGRVRILPSSANWTQGLTWRTHGFIDTRTQ